MHDVHPLITNDATLFGILAAMLGAIFYTSKSEHPIFKKFYGVIPALLLCYFLPSLLTTFEIIDPKQSRLYFMASRYLLPAALILLTLSIDFGEVKKLGPKALIMFFTGTVGVVIGGPLSILFFSVVAPDVVGANPEEIWRGMTTVAGSWIGGGANQAAMKEVFEVSEDIFSAMVTVDVLVAELWMAFLLIGVAKHKSIDKVFKADASAVDSLQNKMEAYTASISKVTSFNDLIYILALAFGATGLAHWMSDGIAPYIGANFPILAKFSLTSGFFWLVVIATTIGIALSFTKARTLEGAGASKVGSVFIYILVATIGMSMNVMEIFHN
ncbi:MAG: DUF819 family protein, partial [Bacteroidetes bacterium]|nr:DUF819 family protein [Bacteroidota bacterium]